MEATVVDPPASAQSAAQLAAVIGEFCAAHPDAVALEDGKVLFDLRTAQHRLTSEHGHCTLQLWDAGRNAVRRVVAATPRDGSLRLATLRLGHSQPRLLELTSTRERRTPTTRDAARTRYLRLLERTLARQFPDERPEAFRTAMDLERSFGPAYARGSQVRGRDAWAVIGAGAHESATLVDGILTLGLLWLAHCREAAGGKRLFGGLRVVVPRGGATLTRARMAWLSPTAAAWELYELDEPTEELIACELADTGNLRTRLVHHPDRAAAAERFAEAVAQVMALVPPEDHGRVEQQLRSSTELVFLLHGLGFARAKFTVGAHSFAPQLEITAGAGEREIPLIPATRNEIEARVHELFRRRRAVDLRARLGVFSQTPRRRIGAETGPAHARLELGARRAPRELRPQQDPLYRAAPERWLESVLRADLSPLTRHLAPALRPVPRSSLPVSLRSSRSAFANEPDPDTRGNRADPDTRGNRADPDVRGAGRSSDADNETRGNRLDATAANAGTGSGAVASRVLPRLDPEHVYSQVPAIAGASDRGLLDLLGVTADGRLAVIELKAADDLHFALQGLDYWIRVRHHHGQGPDPVTGLGELQRHGYFTGVELSPLPPRLYLVAPALHIHPATEAVLRFLSPRVEWTLLALDERWRSEIRVVWRRSGGTGGGR